MVTDINRFLMSRCVFCNVQTDPTYYTLDGHHICSACHNALVLHGGSRKSLEQVEAEIKVWEQKRNTELSASDTSWVTTPRSKTQLALESRSFRIGIVLFIAAVAVLWLVQKASLSTIVISVIGSAIIIIAYHKEQCRQLSAVISEELDEDRRSIEEKNRRRAEFRKDQIVRQVTDESNTLFSRYRKIVSIAKERNMLLYEYYLSDDSSDNPPDWKERREEVLKRDGYRCRYCKSTEKLQVHHITPRGFRGTHHLSNLLTLCSSCHVKEPSTKKAMNVVDANSA